MKKIIIVGIIFMAMAEFSFAQMVNWRSLNKNLPNLVSLNVGYDFGISTQIGYYRYLNTSMPLLVGLDYSFPMGEQLFDDFKVRYGLQMELFELSGFSISAKVLGNMRRHETTQVRMVGFGAELSAIAGYYQPTWHITGEFGFDKSITTNLKHSDHTRDQFPQINDGWYIPSGGQFYYGIQGSKTLGPTFELNLRAGFTNAQGDDEDALLPYYAQIGLVKKF